MENAEKRMTYERERGKGRTEMSKRGKKNNKRNVIKKGEKRDRDAKVLVEGEGGG